MSSDTPASNTQKAGTRVMFGASLSVLGNASTHILAIISIAIMGRLLDPRDFGILAMATVFTGLFEALMNRQFDLALIRTKNVDDSHFDTVFGMSMIWGLSTGLILFLSADFFASMMGEPDLAPVLRVLSLVPVMDSLRNPYFVTFERNLIFLPLVGQHVGSKLAQAGIGVLLAWLWGDYWALVYGFLALSFVRLLPTWILPDRRPRPRLTHWKYFLKFGGWLSGTGLVGFVMLKADTSIVFARLGTATTGLYNMGVELAQMATHHLGAALGQMIYPGLASVADDRARLNGAYFRAQEMLFGIMLPLGIGVAVVAPEAIRVFVGEKWLPAVPVLQAMGPVLALSCLNYNVQAMLMIDGNTRAMFLRNLFVAIVQIPLILILLDYYGFLGAIAARVAATFLHTFLSLQIAGRLTQDHWWRSLTVAWRSFLAAAAMAFAVWMVGQFLGPYTSVAEAALFGLIKIATGGTVFIGCHVLLWFFAGRPDGLEQQISGFGLQVFRRFFPAKSGSI